MMRVGETLSLAGTLRILLIEDDFFTRDLLEELLSEIDAEVTSASSLTEIGSEASPDLVISDLVGPSAHRAERGREYVVGLRARFPQAKILVLTAQSWIVGGAAALPVDDVVAKPFDLGELLLHVHALLVPAQSVGRAAGR